MANGEPVSETDFTDIDDTQPPENSLSEKLVVAVDFGITFSSLAWGRTSRHDELNLIEQWPSSLIHEDERKNAKRVPTTLGFQSPPAWGYQVEDTEPKHQWFKLSLDPSWRNDSSELVIKYPVPIATSFLNANAEQTDDLVVKYLTALKEHSERILAGKFEGVGNALKRLDREYMITVPAVWSDVARKRTRSCAERAGFGVGNSLQLITEPEAAALYQLVHNVPSVVKTGDAFVLCNAGDWVVDLSSYTAATLGPIPEFMEAAPASSGLCGGAFLGRIFADFLKNTFGSHPRWSEVVQNSALDHFESMKNDFTGDADCKLAIPIHPLDNSPWIVDGRLTMSSSDVANIIFEPVVSKVIELVIRQIQATNTNRATVEAVLLDGEFSENDFLKRRLKEVIGKDIQVITSQTSQSSIVLGALMRGLANSGSLTMQGINPALFGYTTQMEIHNQRLAAQQIPGDPSVRPIWSYSLQSFQMELNLVSEQLKTNLRLARQEQDKGVNSDGQPMETAGMGE